MKYPNIIILAFCFLVNSCGSDDQALPGPSIWETISSDSNFSSFVLLIEKAEYDNILDAQNSISVFAPTNMAIDNWISQSTTINSINDLTITEAQELVCSHMLIDFGTDNFPEGNFYFDTPCVTTFSQDTIVLLINNNDNDVLINNMIPINSSNEAPVNGIIHQVDDLISTPILLDFIKNDNQNLNAFEAVLNKVLGTSPDFEEMFSAQGNFVNKYYTLFAFNDEAFQTYLESFEEWNSVDDVPFEILEDILNLHIVENQNITQEEFIQGLDITSLAGNNSYQINIHPDGSMSISNGNGEANLVKVNLQTKNGVIHLIDQIMQ